MPLTDSQITELEDILFSEQLNDEALDYFGLHGLVCANIAGPCILNDDELISLVLGNDDPHILSEDHKAYILNRVEQISEDITSSIDEGTEIYLPYTEESNKDDNSHFDACLESWCSGFLEGFFHNENAWFTKGEDVAAELLLPIMALSGLFESDEFEKIRSNSKLTAQFEEIMPEQIVDIFLFYHSD